MEDWFDPVYKKLAASEVGKAGNTSGIVPVKNTEAYFGRPSEPLRVEFWHDDKSKIITTNVNPHNTQTHHHSHITGNILPAYKEQGARVGDVIVFWKSKYDGSQFKAELIKQSSARWADATAQGADFSKPGGSTKLRPPGVSFDNFPYSEEEPLEYEVLSDIEDSFTSRDFPTVRWLELQKQEASYKPKRSKAKGDFVAKKQNYRCQIDPSHKTFITPVGLPYVEKHHLLSMHFYEEFENDLDDINNIISLCSTCHRQIHLGAKADVSKMLQILYTKFGPNLQAAGFKTSLEDLRQRYNVN